MCIAIYKPAGQWAQKANLRQCFKVNKDGAGYTIFKDGQLHTKKGFFDFDTFWESYEKDVTAADPAFVHFRIATLGSKTADNCHPFWIPGKPIVEGEGDNVVVTETYFGVLMHNGPCLNRTHCGGDKAGDRSDSRQFAEDFIGAFLREGMPIEILKSDPMKKMIEEFVGFEKVAIMFADGSVQIYNESKGNWHEGCWWSNTSYKEYTSTYSTGGAHYGQGVSGTAGNNFQGQRSYRQTSLTDDYTELEDWWIVALAKKEKEERERANGTIVAGAKQEGSASSSQKATTVEELTKGLTVNKPGKFVCVYTDLLDEYIPEHIKLVFDGSQEFELLEWDEVLGGYLMMDRSEDAFVNAMDGYIYDLVEAEDGLEKAVVIGRACDTVAELRNILSKASPLTEEDYAFIDEFYNGFLEPEAVGTEQEAASQQEVAIATSDSKELVVVENSGVVEA